MSTATKLWTPKEATKSLPLVNRIVDDIIRTGKELREISKKKKEDLSEKETVRAETLVTKIKGYLAELEKLGCQYKGWGIEKALIDFPGQIEGESVLLCWATGEERVEWYHGEEEGFAGRKPIPQELLD